VPQLPRFHAYQERIEDERRLAAILLETGEAAPPKTAAGATAGGDASRLRGIPALGRGVQGALAGSSPVGALLAKESRRRR
jgi:hypothetical protein